MLPLARKALLRMGIYYVYGLLGAWIFLLIEKKSESSDFRMNRMLAELKRQVLRKYNVSDEDFNDIVKKSVEAVSVGDELDWTFLNSCGFTFSALTTIGYGFSTPQTELGQGVTILFCLIGLPITMLALKSTGELIALGIRSVILKIETKVLKRQECQHVKVKTFLIASLLTVVVTLLTTMSSILLENWTFTESLYAWFTTFTTIGFGDYVHLLSIQKRVENGQTSTISLIGYGCLLTFPFHMGLCLMSCTLTCLVDAIDQLRNFHNKCTEWVMNRISSLWQSVRASRSYHCGNVNSNFSISQRSEL